jgi:hypothetical protein
MMETNQVQHRHLPVPPPPPPPLYHCHHWQVPYRHLHHPPQIQHQLLEVVDRLPRLPPQTREYALDYVVEESGDGHPRRLHRQQMLAAAPIPFSLLEQPLYVGLLSLTRFFRLPRLPPQTREYASDYMVEESGDGHPRRVYPQQMLAAALIPFSLLEQLLYVGLLSLIQFFRQVHSLLMPFF